MRWSIDNLVQAKRAVGELLEELGLAEYVFEVEPSADAPDTWVVKVEARVDGAWKATELRVDRHALEKSSGRKSDARLELLEAWRARLA